MTPERWRRIENVYHAALLRDDPAERNAFVAEACRADEELQRRIESMLAQDSDGAILDMPAAEVLPASVVAQGRFGPYEIVSRLGEGGMGEVFKAHDSRLKRDVALKVSAREFTDRFGREARAIAALNHPHICTLHDVGPNYLVMEFVEGKPLRGPMPPGQALRWAMQIAEALEHAHRQGIVHRDLKPDNILLTKQGVKLLDFGLAKKVAPPLSESDATFTGALTAAGMVVGTPQYMSPEQIEGRDADARTDIFAFGCVLYEMLTGQRAFDGKSQAGVIAKVLQGDPKSVRDLQPATPPALDCVLRTCLAKDPDERWQTAGDLLRALRLVEEEPGVLPKSAGGQWLWQALTAIAVLGTAALCYLLLSQPHSVTQLVQFTVEAPENVPFDAPSSGVALSPDGRYLTFQAGSRLWLRPIDSLAAQPLTEAVSFAAPFWSPDSRSLGFFSGGKLKRLDIAGGAAKVLCDATVSYRPLASWGPNGQIVFAGPDGLHSVPASGGVPSLVTHLDPSRSEARHSAPQILPDGKRFLYFIESGDSAIEGLYIASFDRPEDRRRLLANHTGALYAPPIPGHPGYLLWVRTNALLAQRLNLKSTVLEGDPMPVAQDINGFINFASFFISASGNLAYLHTPLTTLVWVNRAGELLGEAAPKARIQFFRLRPDGVSLAYNDFDSSGKIGSWLRDTIRGVTTRLSFELPNSLGSTHVFQSLDTSQIYGNGTGGQPPRRLTDSPKTKYLQDQSPDGKYALYEQVDENTGYDLWAVPITSEAKPFAVVRTASNDVAGRFSPDGKWIVYQSAESGRGEIYVQPFPVGGQRWQVSKQGGSRPVWRGDGKEVYFIGPKSMLMGAAVHVSASGAETDTPKPLFTLPSNPGDTPYAVTPDGNRFVVRQPDRQSEALNVIVNWQAGLK